MNLPQDTQKKMMAAYNLLSGQSISIATFEQIRQIVKGIHPALDSKLELASKALSHVQKIQSGDVLSLTAENLPEDTEEKKKRKKALLFFINSIKDLKSEIKRIETELQRAQSSAKQNSMQNQVKSIGRIIADAKGPLGLITVVAVVIVTFVYFANHSRFSRGVSSQPVNVLSPSVTQQTIQVITYNGKQIPVSEFFIGHGPDCDSPHYHAPGETTVTALDGTILKDPGGCGFGKVKDMQVISIPKP